MYMFKLIIDICIIVEFSMSKATAMHDDHCKCKCNAVLWQCQSYKSPTSKSPRDSKTNGNAIPQCAVAKSQRQRDPTNLNK